jgi:hypothetical protein
MSASRGTLLLATAVALCAAPAQADVTGHYAYDNEYRELGPPAMLSMTVEVSDSGNFRLQLPGVPYYILSSAGRHYLVKSDERSVQVMRAEDVDAVLVEQLSDPANGELMGQLDDLERRFSWKEIGPTTLDGWDGVSFGISIDGGPVSERSMLAVSSDPRIQPLARPFLEVQSKGYRTFNRILTLLPPGSKPVFEQGGPLQIIALTLTDTDFAPIDPSRFSLPREPMSLDEIRSSGALFPKSEAPADDDE